MRLICCATDWSETDIFKRPFICVYSCPFVVAILCCFTGSAAVMFCISLYGNFLCFIENMYASAALCNFFVLHPGVFVRRRPLFGSELRSPQAVDTRPDETFAIKCVTRCPKSGAASRVRSLSPHSKAVNPKKSAKQARRQESQPIRLRLSPRPRLTDPKTVFQSLENLPRTFPTLGKRYHAVSNLRIYPRTAACRARTSRRKARITLRIYALQIIIQPPTQIAVYDAS